MKDTTASVDEENPRLARISGAESEPVETSYQRRCSLLRAVLADFEANGIGLRMSQNLPREALYDRDAARAEALAQRDR